MDAFYASVEQRDRPELRGKPVIVGGSGGRGVVSAASYEARAFGVHSAMPGVEARKRCPDAIFVSGDMKKYAAESRRIFKIFRRFTPKVEGLSLDEAFLDMTGTERLLGPVVPVAERLRREVREEVGLAVSVGIAPIKMVAKIASDVSKPDGLVEVPADGVRAFLDPLPIERIWGVGPVTAAKLRAQGFTTIGSLAASDPERLRRWLGDFGPRFARLAQGRDPRDVEPFRMPVSMSEENTFATDVADRGRLEAAIWTHAEVVARRLRKSGYEARTIVLKLKLARRRAPGPRGYPLLTRRATLPDATDDGEVLARTAVQLLAEAELTEPVRLIGVGVTSIQEGGDAQLALFGPGKERERRRNLNRAVDALSERFGHGVVHRAGEGRITRAGLSLQIKRGEEEADDEEE